MFLFVNGTPEIRYEEICERFDVFDFVDYLQIVKDRMHVYRLTKNNDIYTLAYDMYEDNWKVNFTMNKKEINILNGIRNGKNLKAESRLKIFSQNCIAVNVLKLNGKINV